MSALATARLRTTDVDSDHRNHAEAEPSRGYMPLLHRVSAINALLVVAAVVVTVAVLAPVKLSSLALDEEIAVVAGAVVVVVLANVYLLRRVVGPVQALTAFARRVDLTTLGQRMPHDEPTSEAGELARTLNEMLSRLDAERREASGRVLRAQEAERLRIAQELHDQVGQELTAVLLGLAQISARAPQELRHDVAGVSEVVRDSLRDVRRIAIELRPEALDDLGLLGALAVLSERFSEQLGLDVSARFPPDLPALAAETELVVYRVAQEALTNTARHSTGRRAELRLAHGRGLLTLTVRDDGVGLAPGTAAGTGMRGMHERAMLIGAHLEIGNRPGSPGCEVRLEVPLEATR
jgi:two-component system sensor histidine kinase UhpB